MAHELITTKQQELVSVLDKQGIGELLKPLSKEIHLFDSFVAGTAKLADDTAIKKVNVGDKLTLQREESKFDDYAVQILSSEGEKIGYIPEKDNRIFARLMDAGKLLIAKVQKIDQKGSFFQIGIGIYLVDF